jgi:hypothetical protein
MYRLMLVAACLVVALAASGEGKVDDPKFKSAATKKATEDFKKGVAKLDEKYRKELEKARADYVLALGEARKEAIKANDLEEAQRIVAAIKDTEDAATANKIAAVRQRVAGSAWEWTWKDHILSLHADGTATTSWHKDEKGYWYVNPDGTVFWWTSGHGVAAVMKFNATYTAHESVTPTRDDMKRAGKRVKYSP